MATLEYLRKYHTYAHIAASYGIVESNIYRGIKWVEDTLVRDGIFSLPGRKAPLKTDVEYKVILVDATESPIERPKKAKAILFRKEKAWQKILCKRYSTKSRMALRKQGGIWRIIPWRPYARERAAVCAPQA